METKIALFQGKEIRKTLHNEEWWFSVIDVISVLTGSEKPRDYWYRMKVRVNQEEEFEPSTICRQFSRRKNA